ncbi:vacuolar ATP synthase subunit C, putative [Cryptosporidium muris RN66]|uniref:V-type proton ATPase subunit C n=1 Tax=Cryptosporidium muris (strain RN66) TaxID=441375 RepID=B6AEH5_CRYMR|nr:vacuolar ATP synthase subunit C, putative [Cryptosporidium muris RN66]EEA06592.1 vacuolar ATP synthase subunit C, putative [Cryptosporidium muris RN66]|eukprot:XP_002140941.1 vacuolar ATP synthase subunit C [Cryptosporidium muris RN66]
MSFKGISDGQGQQYWIVACALAEEGLDAIYHEMNVNLKKVGQNIEVMQFDIPFSLKFGAFDDLVRLADELIKHDTGIEVVLRRVERMALDLDPTMELRIIWQRSSYTIKQYLCHFSWDHAKFPKERSMHENLNALLQGIQKLDTDLRSKSSQFNEIKQAVLNNLGKDFNSNSNIQSSNGSGSGVKLTNGLLTTKDLIDVITPDVIDESDILFTEHISTVFVVVPKGQHDSFLKYYERSDPYVVPKSAKFIPKIIDKEGNELVRVFLFQSSMESFKQNCKSRKFTVRDDFHYSQEKYRTLMENRKKLVQEKGKQEKYLKRMCFASFSDIFISWLHIKAMRCFVEAVLRYGVPPQFASFLIRMDVSSSKFAKAKNVVETTFKKKGKIGTLYKSSSTDKEIDDDYTPYVFLPFSPDQQV